MNNMQRKESSVSSSEYYIVLPRNGAVFRIEVSAKLFSRQRSALGVVVARLLLRLLESFGPKFSEVGSITHVGSRDKRRIPAQEVVKDDGSFGDLLDCLHVGNDGHSQEMDA